MKRLNILVSAHEFSPYNGSECAVGWNIVTRLAKYHDVTVLYASGSQFRHNSYVDVLNKYFETSPAIPGLTCINIDKPRINRWVASLNSAFKKLTPVGLPALYYIGYRSWQKAAYRKAKELHAIKPFDAVHQLTQITFREPGYMWKLDIPFFWGPTGGTSVLPRKFNKMLSGRYRLLEGMRTASNHFQFRFASRIHKANKKASVIYTFSHDDARKFGKRASGQVKIMLDVGTYKINGNSMHIVPDSPVLKGVWCGQLSERKAPSILLKALTQDELTREKVEFQLIGSGPLEHTMLKQVKDLGLKNVRWVKNVAHDDIFKMMGEADFFVHTSLREATSSVIPEAISMGLPVICHDADGMSIAINEKCGIKIPLTSPENSIHDFHEAIKRLIVDDRLLSELRKGARERAPELSWDKMAETIATDYSTIAGKAENN